MGDSTMPWLNATHDWSSTVDAEHLAAVRQSRRRQPIKKPVMDTRDIRFFDLPDAELLPDGHPRRGRSVVAALSDWLVHTNRRRNGAWTQRYEHGIPVTDLVPFNDDGTSGTTVHLLPGESLRAAAPITARELRKLTAWRRSILGDGHSRYCRRHVTSAAAGDGDFPGRASGAKGGRT